MAKISFGHPSRKRLAMLLDGAVRPDGGTDEADAVAAHVEQCERCADRFEELSELEDAHEAGFADKFGTALREIYAPPAGINDRVFMKIDEQERSAREMSLFLGMFGIPSETANLMMPGASGQSRREVRRNGRNDQ